MDDFATAITGSIAKDGQTTPTANLPMGTYRHTGVGNGSARTDYAAMGQVQDGKINWVDGGGTADAITATYSPAITALVDGQLCFVRATAANATTTPTFAPNGLTARTIVKKGGSALVAGDIVGDGHELQLRYDLTNTRWELLNPGSYAGLGANTFTGLQQLAYSTTIASGATVDLGTATGNSVSVTHSSGTTAITSFGGASLQRGTTILVTPSITGGTLTITHHATDLILPGSSNITLASGDRLLMQKLSSSLAQWWLVGGVKADGTAWVKTPVSSTSVTFTRDMTTATGTQAVTGVGFTPTAIIFVYAVSGTVQEGIGFADSSKTGRNRNYLTPTGWFVGTQAISASVSSGNSQVGDVSTYDSDGFTISWTKTGSPTGTLTVYALCLR